MSLCVVTVSILEWQDHVVSSCLSVRETAKQFSEFYCPHSHQQHTKVPGAPQCHPHSMSLVLVISVILVMCSCISFALNVFVFMRLFSIPVASFVKNLFESFCPFLNWVVFLSLNYKSSSYVLDTGLLLGMRIVTILSSLCLAFSFSRWCF